MQRLKFTEIQKIAKDRGLLCYFTADEYINNWTKLKFKCKFGHVLFVSVKALKKYKACIVCRNGKKESKRRPEKIFEARKIAENHGGECLSENYINNITKLKFKCKNGHIWQTNFKTINRGGWCPYCGKTKLTEEEKQKRVLIAQKTAKQRGGKCLTKKYIRTGSYWQWQCNEGHIWNATYYNVINGSWCPECCAFTSEILCKTIFEKLFNKPFLKTKPPWLVNKKGKRLELDGYCEELGIAFEHNGMQHYKITSWQKTQKQLNKIIEHDEIKQKLCRKHGVKLIIIPAINYKIKISELGSYLTKEFKRLNIKEKVTINIKLLSSTMHRVRNNIELLQKIAAEDGKRIIEFDAEINRYLVKCKLCKNIWHTQRISITKHKQCPKCNLKSEKTILDAQNLAKQNGGECLSKNYKNNHIKLKWKCKCGNIWFATYNAIQSGRWCPPCSFKRAVSKRKLDISAYHEAARKKHGECLSEYVENCFQKLMWKCSLGHVWEATAHSIKNTKRWCPECYKNK